MIKHSHAFPVTEERLEIAQIGECLFPLFFAFCKLLIPRLDKQDKYSADTQRSEYDRQGKTSKIRTILLKQRLPFDKERYLLFSKSNKPSSECGYAEPNFPKA